MSSKSIQHKAYRTQPRYQISNANLPHPPPKEIVYNYSNVAIGKTKKQKLKYLNEYKYLNNLIRKSITGYNWKLLKPKKLGYILVSSWSNDGKETRSGPCKWGYRDINTGFIYVGNASESWKLGTSHAYYNSSYASQDFSKVLTLLNSLDNPLE